MLAERIAGAVSSSVASTQRLRSHGISVLDANEVERIPVYIDGADEIDHQGCMVKGGGAALTREKIVADLAERFVCIADQSKLVAVMGRFPLPVEVIPMAAAQVARRFAAAYGGAATVRAGVTTDNGNLILDVHDLDILKPLEMETAINQIAGVVCCGIFARQHAHVLLLGADDGVKVIR